MSKNCWGFSEDNGACGKDGEAILLAVGTVRLDKLALFNLTE
jgi:hypothetical protein